MRKLDGIYVYGGFAMAPVELVHCCYKLHYKEDANKSISPDAYGRKFTSKKELLEYYTELLSTHWDCAVEALEYEEKEPE